MQAPKAGWDLARLSITEAEDPLWHLQRGTKLLDELHIYKRFVCYIAIFYMHINYQSQCYPKSNHRGDFTIDSILAFIKVTTMESKCDFKTVNFAVKKSNGTYSKQHHGTTPIRTFYSVRALAQHFHNARSAIRAL